MSHSSTSLSVAAMAVLMGSGLASSPAAAQQEQVPARTPADATASGATSTTAPVPQNTGDTTAPLATNAAGAADIIVTAERRSVSIQKTPLAISAFSGDQLVKQNVADPTAIQTLVPAVKFIEIGQQPSLLIRGVGQAVANIYNDPSASFNIDGVAVARPLSINGLFFDLERVEVLKGPQGTLYGRNSTSGAINVISARPTFDFAGSVGGQLESYNGVQARGMLNVPLSDTLAVRAGFLFNRHDGYISNGTDDADSIGGRIKLLWTPSATFSILATATLYRDTGKGVGDVPLKSPTGSFINPNDPYFVAVGPALNAADGATKVPDDARQNLRSNSYSGEINWDLGPAKLTLVPAYLHTTYGALTYNGGFRQVITSGDKQGSGEARLSSTGKGPFQWIVGGIYLNDDQFSFNDLKTRATSRQLQNTFDAKLESYAFFAQASYAIMPSLRATGGVRYTHDHKTIRGVFITVADVPGDPVLSSFPSNGDVSFNNVSFKAGLDYDVAAGSLLYANVSTGYKAGGFQPGLAPNIYKPETITAYEIGSKNKFFDRRATINLAAWYWDYRNYDLVQFGFVNPAPNIALTTLNVPKVKDYGVEVDSTFDLTAHDQLIANFSYVHATYGDLSVPAFAPTGVPAATYTGESLNAAPRFSGIVGYTHTFDLHNGGHISASVQSQFETGYRIAIQNITGATVGGDRVTDAVLTYRAPGDRYQVSAYVNNMEDAPVLRFAGNTPAGLWGHPRPPRIFGVRGSAKF